MGYWIDLQDDKGVAVTVPHHSEGGTYAVGGIDVASIYVTYNYSERFDFASLHDKTAFETFSLLRQAVLLLGVTRDEDYWKPTPGNAGYAASILLWWAALHPEGRWSVR
jgi:hypothetical protein